MLRNEPEPDLRGRSFLLYTEDFDAARIPADEHEPELILPEPAQAGPTAEDLEEAKCTAYEEGWQAHAQSVEARLRQNAQQCLAAIAEGVAQMRESCAEHAEAAAEALARDMLHILSTMLPSACAAFGAMEAAAVARALLPALPGAPVMMARVSPQDCNAVADELRMLDPQILERVTLIPSDALSPGDIRVTWQEGEATRDTGAIWTEIAEILAPLGLSPVPACTDRSPAHV